MYWTKVNGSPHVLTMSAGDQFALFESVVALAMLARRFDFRLAANAPKVGMTTVSCFTLPVLSCNSPAGHCMLRLKPKAQIAEDVCDVVDLIWSKWKNALWLLGICKP